MPRVPGSGRKPGSKNKKPIYNVTKTLRRLGIDPFEEALKDLPKLDTSQRVKFWTDMIRINHGRPRNGIPKPDEKSPIDVTPSKSEYDKLSAEELKQRLVNSEEDDE